MTDVVWAITHFLTPELEKISSAAGLERASGQKAIEAVVPAILSCLVELAGKPGGDWRLAGAVAAQPSDTLSAFAGDFIELAAREVSGSSVLPALLGESFVSKMASILGNFADIEERQTRTLMALLTPVIMGVLGRELRASGFDVKGLARLLIDQREEIAAAMPTGLSDLLMSELHQEVGPHPSHLSRWSDGAPPRYSTMRRALSDGAPRDMSRAGWSALALPLLVALGLVWWGFLFWWLLLPSSPPQVAEGFRAGQTIAGTAQEVSSSKSAFISRSADDWVSINGYLNQDIYNRFGEKLGKIDDVLIGPDGRLNAVVVTIDRRLGLGNKDIAVPFAALHLGQRGAGARLVFDATKDALRSAPAFEVHSDASR